MELINQPLEITPDNLVGMIEDYIKNYYLPNILDYHGEAGGENYEIINTENRADVYHFESRVRIDIFLQNIHVGIFGIQPLNSLKSFVQFSTPECEFIQIEQSLLSQMIDLRDFICGHLFEIDQLPDSILNPVKSNCETYNNARLPRRRGPNIGTIERVKDAIKNWLDGDSSSFNSACELAGVDDETVKSNLSIALSLFDEGTREKYTKIIIAIGKEDWLQST
jgi:hypothetical protein